MLLPSIPADEAARLKALHDLQIMDTPAEERFDRLTRLACQYFHVPVALVSLVDKDRQWFKSRQGLDFQQSGRDVSFCAHAIHGDDVFVIEDASRDPRFVDHPFVIESPDVRFYAGAPLHSPDGMRVGTLCVIGTEPRKPSPEDLRYLRDLADCVEEEFRRIDLVRVQFEVAKKNQILRGHLFNTPLGAISWDREFRVISWNPSAEKIFGFSAEEAMGKHASELILPAGLTRDIVDSLFEDLLAAQGGMRSTNANLTKDGRKIICDWYNTPVADPTGVVVEVASLVEDITERLQMEAALKSSEERFRDFAEIASDWLWETDAELRFSYISEAFEKISGHLPATLLGRTRWEFADPEVSGRTVEDWAKHRAEMEGHQQIRDFQYRVRGKDGSSTTFSINGKPVFDENGRFTGYRGTGKDISRLVEMYAEMLQAKNEAEEASRAKSEFLSSMSHELRTPLNAVIGFSQLMVTDEHMGEAHRDWASEVLQAGEHLLELVNDVLDLSKIEAGHMELQMEQVELVPLLEEVQRLVAPLAQKHGITVRLEPPVVAGIRADRVRLKQVLINLVSNAVKYNRPGGSVTVYSQVSGSGMLRLLVKDTGRGMTSEQIAQLFQPFNRLGRESGPVEGTGIGLALAKRMTELMHGQIGVESQVDAGSTFWVELPALQGS